MCFDALLCQCVGKLIFNTQRYVSNSTRLYFTLHKSNHTRKVVRFLREACAQFSPNMLSDSIYGKIVIIKLFPRHTQYLGHDLNLYYNNIHQNRMGVVYTIWYHWVNLEFWLTSYINISFILVRRSITMFTQTNFVCFVANCSGHQVAEIYMSVWIWAEWQDLVCMTETCCGHTHNKTWRCKYRMMTPSNRKIFCGTGHLCGEFTGHRWFPRTKASDAELWCYLWINGWVNNREAGDLRRHRTHYDVTVMGNVNCTLSAAHQHIKQQNKIDIW